MCQDRKKKTDATQTCVNKRKVRVVCTTEESTQPDCLPTCSLERFETCWYEGGQRRSGCLIGAWQLPGLSVRGLFHQHFISALKVPRVDHLKTQIKSCLESYRLNQIVCKKMMCCFYTREEETKLNMKPLSRSRVMHIEVPTQDAPRAYLQTPSSCCPLPQSHCFLHPLEQRDPGLSPLAPCSF